MMHKLLSSRTVSNDAINKNHHQQQQVHQHQPVQQQIPLKTQSHQSVQLQQQQQQQQYNKQKQQSNHQQSNNHRYSNHLSPVRVGKDATNYEKFISNCSGSGTIKSISDIQPSKVKMSGYLKKKRTKVGGWRKMWFVLQNQLLLSYSSKENYDKKLVSFKDVLNLVPGTTIHPLGSFRFAIETTTNVMYNFRCDDSESYNKWLNALIESLSLNLQERKSSKSNESTSNNHSSTNSINIQQQQQKFKNSISLDNIQRTTPPNKKPIKSCNSSDSISRFNLSRMPNIPIADATAKILQRNGIPSNGASANEFNIQKKIGQNDRNRNSVGSINSSGGSNHSSNVVINNTNKCNRQNNEQLETFCDKQERARNFRLHEKRLSSGMLQQNLHQSDEVSRINRMFCRSRSTNNVTNSTTTTAQQAQQATVVHLNDKNSFVTTQATTTLGTTIDALKTTSTSSPRSSIVNIVNNPQIVGKVKSSSSSTLSAATSSSKLTSNGTSVGIASIISLKDGYGRSYSEQRNPLNYHTNNNNKNITESFFINNNGNQINLNHRLTENQNLIDNNKKQLNHNNNIIKNPNQRRKCNNSGYNLHNNNNNYKFHNLLSDNKNFFGGSGGGGGSSSGISGSDKRNSQQFFPVIGATLNMTNDNDDIIYNNEMDIVVTGHISNSNSVSSDNSNLDGSSNTSSPIKYKIMENSKTSDNNDSQQNFLNNSGGNNSCCSNSSNNSINNSNSSNNSTNDIIGKSNGDVKNQINNDVNNDDIRDLNQNRMFHVNYEKIDFQKDKDADGDYECYPLQQKMQDLNICKHQKLQQQSQQNVTSDKRTINQNSSPFKKSISLERGGQHPFYTETEFPMHSINHHHQQQQQYNHYNNHFGITTTSSPHQSLQNFSHINSPIKDEFSLSSSSTTTSNSRCNSSLVTTESTHSITNSPTNDEDVGQRYQLQYQQHNPKHKSLTITTSTPTRKMDSRIHPDLQPSESMENDLHMMNIIVHNDGDGESTTEDIFVNVVNDEHQRPASAQCISSSTEHNAEDGSEPIYALVNLKNKHARRAKLRELQDQLAMLTEARDRDRPRSLQCISSDYEEVLNFECMQDEDDAGEDDDDDENENIYEPINIPEYGHQRQQHNHRHALWKYFRRINIEALLDLARSKKMRSPRHLGKTSKYDSAPLQPTMSLPPDAYSHHHQQTSPFSDIRRKLGNHRKSIKLRMKRFYNRHDLRNSHTNVHSNAIIKERNAFSDDELDSQGATGSTGSGVSENSLKSSDGTTGCSDEKRATSSSSFVFGEIDKYRRGQKQFFGSLSRLKKTRTSVSLEEDDVKIFSNNMMNSNSNSSSNGNKPWLVSPKMNRSEEKISIVSTKFPKKNDDIPNQTKFYKN